MTNELTTTEEAQKALMLLAFVQPIEDIINKLEAGEYGDKDLPWLEKRLDFFMATACLVLELPYAEKKPYTVYNSFSREQYIKYFGTFLKVFKSYL